MRGALIVAFAAAAVLTNGRAADAKIEDAIAWYGTLQNPDVRDCPYVRVATGQYVFKGGLAPKNTYIDGFLLGSDRESFRVFICEIFAPDANAEYEGFWPLTTKRFVRKSSSVPPDAATYVGYENLDLAARALEIEKLLQNPQSRMRLPGSLMQLSERARVFSFAVACRQKGFDKISQSLLEHAAAISWRTGQPPDSLRDALQQDMGDAALWRYDVAIGNPSLSRTDLLHNYERFLKDYPASDKVPQVRQTVAVLRQMIAEDAEHHPKPMNDLSKDQQIAEWIFRLRDLHTSSWIMPGTSTYPIGSGRSGEKRTPVHELVDFGFAAVPQLIDSLDDPRLTRSLQEPLSDAHKPWVITVGECAHRILDHLAGRNFNAWDPVAEAPDKRALRAQIESWWAEVQSKGEVQILADTIATGSEQSWTAAQKLARQNPTVALEAIQKGIRATGNLGLRRLLIETAAAIKGDAPVPLLKAELSSDHGLPARTAAAKGLLARKHTEAIAQMISAWDSFQPQLKENKPVNPATDPTGLTSYEQIGPLISLLARCGSTGAVESLARHFPTTPVDVRLAIVEALAPPNLQRGLSATGLTVNLDYDFPITANSEADLAAEHLLVKALDDTEPRPAMSGNFDEVSFKEPRICDMAAFALSKRWPERYRFHWGRESSTCDAQIARMKTTGTQK